MYGLIVALCVAQSGSLFAADSWHDVTLIAGEVKNPEPQPAAGAGVRVHGGDRAVPAGQHRLYGGAAARRIKNAPSDRVATAMLQRIFPGYGPVLMAIGIMISTFGCVNSLVLAGARATFAMARDGLFFERAGVLNKAHVPGWGLVVQGIWAAVLVLPRTYNTETRQYGNLYSNLLDYVISAALLFYILTIAGVFRLRQTRPNADRPYRVAGIRSRRRSTLRARRWCW